MDKEGREGFVTGESAQEEVTGKGCLKNIESQFTLKQNKTSCYWGDRNQYSVKTQTSRDLVWTFQLFVVFDGF